MKGTILPPLHRENDVIIAREVPIINVLLDDAMKEEPKLKSNIKIPTVKDKELKIKEHKTPKIDTSSEAPKDAYNACEMGTQTEKIDKKGGCLLM